MLSFALFNPQEKQYYYLSTSQPINNRILTYKLLTHLFTSFSRSLTYSGFCSLVNHDNLKRGSLIDARRRSLFRKNDWNLFSIPSERQFTSGVQWMMFLSSLNSAIFSFKIVRTGRTHPADIFSSFWKTSRASVSGFIILIYSLKNSSSKTVSFFSLKWSKAIARLSLFFVKKLSTLTKASK